MSDNGANCKKILLEIGSDKKFIDNGRGPLSMPFLSYCYFLYILFFYFLINFFFNQVNISDKAWQDSGTGPASGVSWDFGITWAWKRGCKMAVTEHGNSLWNNISISWHGGKELSMFFQQYHPSVVPVVRGTLTRHRRFLVVASQSGFMPTQTTMPPTGIGGRNHAKITTYHCTIFVTSNSLGHNLSIGTMIFAWQALFNL